MENTNQDGLAIIQSQSGETEKAKERPIKVKVWENAPEGDVELSIRERISEFFDSSEVPPESKVFGVLSQELLVKNSRELDGQNYQMALNNRTPYAGKPTVYAMELYEDRLNLVLSPIGDYPNFSLGVASLPLERLDFMTGGIAKDVAGEIPEVIDTLLSRDSTAEQKGQAKVDLMRFLAKKKPDDVKGISETFSANTGLTFVPDRQNPVVKLYMEEIPTTDPVLGETMELFNAIKIYKDTEVMMNNAEMLQMTTEKIAGYLKKLPEWAQKKLMGQYPDPGFKSWRIFQFFEKFGYKGNQFQQKFEKSQKMSMGFVSFTEQLRTRILQTVVKGTPPKENGLDKESIDKFFVENYEQRRGNKKLPEGFSITDVIMNKVPITDLKIG